MNNGIFNIQIGEHVLRSGVFQPLTPPPEHVNMDYTQFERLRIGSTPNLLIVPSDMIPFAKMAGETLVLNPGRLTKGKGGGSYAIVQLNSERHKAKILKI